MKNIGFVVLAILLMLGIILLSGCAAVMECAKPTSTVDYHSDRHGIQLSCGSQPDA